ncbi:MAG TPA: class II aldolase [Rhodospirillaceae bacterium]|nr:class II aldolase [Rhodospirillaceae bacterium]HAA91486.1 class II aldolase [Rhodospirillaceae bacterium]HAT35917.1 class II aldolase [Rhodospirillaceae bacterium]
MSLKDKVSPEEWQTRVDLAAAYRLCDYYDMTDLTGTHLSARVPGEPDHFLLNPYGLYFEEVTATSLIKLTLDGDIVEDHLDLGVNAAGYTIHSAVLDGRDDVHSVMHTHTRAGIAVSSMECGLLPLSQHSMHFYKAVSYHDYEGVAVNLDEREMLQRDLGSENMSMMLKNHGLLTCGVNVSSAFHTLMRLEKSCQAQVDAMSTGGELHLVPETVSEHTNKQFKNRGTELSDRGWPGHLRRLDKMDPSYAH